MTDKPKHGGLRNPPGGRPPKAAEARKAKISISLSQATVDRIREQRQRPNEPLSQIIERLLSAPDQE